MNIRKVCVVGVAVPAGAIESEICPETSVLDLQCVDSMAASRGLDSCFRSHSGTQNSHTRSPSCGFQLGRLFVRRVRLSHPSVPLHIGHIYALESLYAQSLELRIHHSTSKPPLHTRNAVPTNTLLAGSQDVCEQSGLDRELSMMGPVPIG